MPYIKNDDRSKFDSAIQELADVITTPGEFNYVITKLIHTAVPLETLDYQDINGVIGMLECVKLEYYRKIAAPYEDQKEFENGKI